MKKILLSIFCLVVANVFAQSQQTRTLNDGTVEKGFFHNNCGNWKGYCGAVMHGFGITLEGDGKRIYPNGEIEEGVFNLGLLTKGRYTKSNKEIIEGEFKNGLPEGQVVIINSEGKKRIGFYTNGIENRSSPVTQVIGSESVGLNSNPSNLTSSLEDAKKKCSDLGFKSGTEGFGKCVLQLSK